MKKLLLAIVVAALLAPVVNAQEQQPEWRFGLNIQPSVSWLSTTLKEFKNDGVKFNFSYGGMIEKSLRKNTALSAGFMVSDFGGIYTYSGAGKHLWFKGEDSVAFTGRKMKLTYLDIPVALKFRTPRINYLTYAAHFGLDFGFRARALSEDDFIELKAGKGNKTGIYEEDIHNDINFMKLGLNLGIGAEYVIAGNTAVFAEINYINGFTNITRKKSEMFEYSDNSLVKQIFYGNVVALKIGVLF